MAQQALAGLYPKNRKMTKNIAILILVLVGIQSLGLLSGMIDLNAITVWGSTTLFGVLSTAGVLWVAYGLHIRKIGN